MPEQCYCCVLKMLAKTGLFLAVNWQFSFIHVTPVAEAHLSNASPFQTPLITPKQQTDQTNKQRQLPSRVMSSNVLCSTP
jgi:hypothetical protein